jgi:hypothetical protein
MIKTTRRLLIALMLSLSLVSCTTPWSAQQRQKAIPTSVRRATTANMNYTNPQFMSQEAAETTGLVVGIAGGLIGGAIAGGIAAGAQNSYEKKYQAEFSLLRSQVYASGLSESLRTSLVSELQTIPHFRGQVNDSSRTNFSMEITQLGFVRMPGSSPNHAPFIQVKVKQTAADGEKLLEKNFLVFGNKLKGARAEATVASYARDRDLLNRHLQLLANDVARQCREELLKKLAN